LGAFYFASIVLVSGMFAYHLWLIKDRDTVHCFAAFNQSKWIGLIVLAGICSDFWLGSAGLVNPT